MLSENCLNRSRKIVDLIEQVENNLNFLNEIGVEFFSTDSPARRERNYSFKKAEKNGCLGRIESIEELNRLILSCQKCPLSSLRTQAVPGEGSAAAELMFVGEAPGRDEDLQGRPFVGRAGQLLRKIIAAMDLAENEVYITNVVKCRPPENRIPAKEEIQICSSYLIRQIKLIQPKVIVSLGRVPTEFFMPSGRRGMSELRGNFIEFGGLPVMPTFHPSYLIRNEANRDLKRQVWEDMKKVMSRLNRK